MNIRSAPGARILGMGSYRPTAVVTNDDIAALGVQTSDEWIRTRVGVGTRHIAADDETVPDMATVAGGKALAAAGIEPDQVDLVIVATCSMQHTIVNAASTVGHRLGIPAPGAFDVNGACAGFCYGLSVAQDAIRAGSARTVLLVGAEKMSSVLDWTDRGTCIIFGDGAGAAVLTMADEPQIGPVVWGSDGERGPSIWQAEDTGKMYMDGQPVFRWATGLMHKVALQACEAAGVAPTELGAIVPHQANLRIVEAIAAKIGAPQAAVARDIVDSGNTSSASIPLALTTMIERGEVASGQPVLVVGFGAGLTYAGQVLLCP